MAHHYFYLFARKHQLFGILVPYILSINIAIDTSKGATSLIGEAACNVGCSKITRMPDLIAILKMLKYIFIQVTMSIRYEADACQEDLN